MNIFELFSRRALAGPEWAETQGETLTEERLDLLADLRDVAEQYPYLGQAFVRELLSGNIIDADGAYYFVLTNGLGHITSYQWSKMNVEATRLLVSFLSGFRDGGVINLFGAGPEYKLRQAKEACKRDAYRLTDAVLADGSFDFSPDAIAQLNLLRILCEDR